jgi:hypothetical protein
MCPRIFRKPAERQVLPVVAKLPQPDLIGRVRSTLYYGEEMALLDKIARLLTIAWLIWKLVKDILQYPD